MHQGLEQGVNECLKSFQTFCLDQIVAAWFADAPDPAALTDVISDSQRAAELQGAATTGKPN